MSLICQRETAIPFIAARPSDLGLADLIRLSCATASFQADDLISSVLIGHYHLISRCVCVRVVGILGLWFPCDVLDPEGRVSSWTTPLADGAAAWSIFAA